MTKPLLILCAAVLLVNGEPVGAGESDTEYPPFRRDAEIESRSWSVGGYTKRTYKGRDSQGNRFGGTIEELPSGAVKFKSWEKRSPVQGRVERFLERRQRAE